jgi:hypothetical protein
MPVTSQRSTGNGRGDRGVILLVCTVLYAAPRTAVLGAILLTAYLGGAVATQLRVGAPLFTDVPFGVYLGVLLWGGVWLRDARVRALAPLRTPRAESQHSPALQ